MMNHFLGILILKKKKKHQNQRLLICDWLKMKMINVLTHHSSQVPHLQTPAPPAQIHCTTFQPVLVSLAPLSYFLYFIPAQLVEQTIWVYTYNDSKGIFYSVPSQASILTQEFCTLTKGGYFTLRHKLSHG